MNGQPLLGWIEPKDRNPFQQNAHALAEALMIRQHGLTAPDLVKGTKIVLTDAWNHPAVTTDVGRRFIRQLQLTGSCVNVGGANALQCTVATQRIASENPTKAFQPFTWHNYAMSRHYLGDDGQGEGSLGSTWAKSLKQDGVIEWPQDPNDKLPDYTQSGDHINITAAQEMAWSSFRNPQIQAVLAKSKEHLLGNAALLRSTNDIKAMVVNGYGVTVACDRFIGAATVQGDACVGSWDNQGGHQQWAFGYWEHPTLGPLFAIGNNWGDNTYPKDPAGLPLCCCWVKEANVAKVFGYHAEVYGLSNLDWFPAQPKVYESWADLIP